MIGGPEPEPTPDETKPSGFMVFSAEKSKTAIFLPKKKRQETTHHDYNQRTN